MRYGLACTALSTVLSLVVSHGVAFATCEEVYLNSTRNIIVSETSHSELKALFDFSCSNTGEVKSDEMQGNADIIAKKIIPLKLGLKKKSSIETVASFCKDYRDTRFSSEMENVTSSLVEVEALKNLNICKELEINKVSLSHRFVNPNSVIFDFIFRTGGEVVVGVSQVATDSFTCESTNIDPNKGKINLNNLSYQIEARKTFNIVCNRKPRIGEDGREIFDPGSIGIALTGASSGSYVVSMPADENYSYRLASEAQETIRNLKAKLEAAEKEGATAKNIAFNLQRRLENTTANVFVVSLGSGSGPGRNVGEGWTLEKVQQSDCPYATRLGAAGSVADITAPDTGVNTFAYSCLYIPP